MNAEIIGASAMRVLDLDLDFFLDSVPYHCDMEGTARLSANDYHPWAPSKVRRFLERRCGLSRSNPSPGFAIQDHKDAFFLLRNLIQKKIMLAPFHIDHVDAHADLGCGDGGYIYLMTNILHLPVADRINPNLGFQGLNCGNYLAFAIAARWVSSLHYITHKTSQNDVMYWHLKNFDPSATSIQLKKCDPIQFMKGLGNQASNASAGVIATEPEVPFRKIPWQRFSTHKRYDLVILCTSPSFTPADSDALIPIIGEYLNNGGQ